MSDERPRQPPPDAMPEAFTGGGKVSRQVIRHGDWVWHPGQRRWLYAPPKKARDLSVNEALLYAVLALVLAGLVLFAFFGFAGMLSR